MIHPLIVISAAMKAVGVMALGAGAVAIAIWFIERYVTGRGKDDGGE